jgi:hypothetical protein
MHQFLPFEMVVEQTSMKPKIDIDIEQGMKAMQTIFEALQKFIEQLKEEHDRLMEAHLSEFEYRETRAKFLALDNSYQYTGGLMSRMIKQMEKPICKYPYQLNKIELVNQLLPQVHTEMEHVAKLMRDAWRFDLVRARSTFNVDQTLSLQAKNITSKNFSKPSPSVKAIVLDKCKST